MDTQLVRALLNPTRIRILDAVAEGPASAGHLAERLGERPSVISYHVRVLSETGCIRLSEDPRISAADERAYELTPEATPTRRLPQQAASSALGHPSAAVLRSIVGGGATGGAPGLPGRGGQDQLSCVSIVLDQRGWQEVSAAIGVALDRVSIAHEESARRLADADEDGITATVAVASFESPRCVAG